MNDGVAICRRRRPDAGIAAPGRAPLPRRAGRRPRRRASTLALAAQRRAPSRCRSACVGNAAEVLPELLRRGVADRHRHRPDLAHDPLAYLPDRRRRSTTGTTTPRAKPGGVHRAGPRRRWPGTSRRWSASRTPAPRSSTTATRSATRRAQGGYDRAFDVPRLRAGLHPAAVLRGQGPVPLGRALRRPGRHRRDRPGRARAVPRQRAPAHAGSRMAGERVALPGPAGAHLLARLRRARPGRAAVQRDGRLRRARAPRS